MTNYINSRKKRNNGNKIKIMEEHHNLCIYNMFSAILNNLSVLLSC